MPPYREQLGAGLGRVVTTAFRADGEGAGPTVRWGNWVADLLYDAAADLFPEHRVAFAAQNYGGIRVRQLGSGPVTVSAFYELMPFDNELILLELGGAQLGAFADLLVADGGWPVSKGLTITSTASGNVVRIDGQPLVPSATYFVAVPDYVANGGDAAAMLSGQPQLPSGQLIRDLLIEYAGRQPGPVVVDTAAAARITLRP